MLSMPYVTQLPTFRISNNSSSPLFKGNQDELNQQLLNGVNDKNLTEVMKAVRAGADVNTKTKINESAIHLAVEQEALADVQELLGFGADINLEGYWGTPLMLAASKKDSKLLKELLNHSPNVNQAKKQYSYWTPLKVAYDAKQYENIALLLASGATTDSINNQTLLHVAIGWHLNDQAKLLMNQKVIDVNAQDKYGRTPLVQALQSNNTEMFDFLLQHQVDVKKGFLLANVKAVDEAKKLLDLGAMVDEAALENAIKKLNPELLALFLKHRSNTEPLPSSLLKSTDYFVKSLVAEGWVGFRPKREDVLKAVPKMMELLIDAGVDITDGQALKQAVTGGFKDVLTKILIKLYTQGQSFDSISQLIVQHLSPQVN